jgi:hypothetical protein
VEWISILSFSFVFDDAFFLSYDYLTNKVLGKLCI